MKNLSIFFIKKAAEEGQLNNKNFLIKRLALK